MKAKNRRGYPMTEVKTGSYVVCINVSDDELMKIDKLAERHARGRKGLVKFALEHLARSEIFEDRDGLKDWSKEKW